MKNKKQFTLIELIIVIVVIGFLAAMALPKFNGIIRNAKLAVMINDKEVLEKALVMYYQKNDTLPLLNEDEELIANNTNIGLTKIVLAEEVQNEDMDTIYKSLKETLTYYNDNEDALYRIDLLKIKDNISKDIKYGHKKHDKDFYVYSTKTGSVYYYDYLVNGNGTIQHTEYDTLLKDNELIKKEKSYNLDSNGIAINNKPIVGLTTNLENIKSDTIINWAYTFIDEDETPTKISFILNEVEYDSFDKIPTSLKDGEYVIKLKMQDSKGIWSNEIIKNFVVENIITIQKDNIALGGFHSIKIGEDGNLYSWGWNNYGQLGIGNTIRQTTPNLVTLPNGEKPISVSLGSQYSIVLTDKKNVYTWGKNNRGQLGTSNDMYKTTPQKVFIPNNEIPMIIKAGDNHSMLITMEGNIYSWGENDCGQLGLGNTVNQTTPQLVTLPNGEKPIFVSLGYKHSSIITAKGNLYMWGNNNYGQLGLGNTINQTTPQLVTLPNEEKVTFVSLGYNATMAISDKKNVYSWGYNALGQLGLGNTVNQTTPNLVTLPNGEKPISIFIGNYHSMAITNKGNLYAWGYNGFGQLGLGNTVNQTTPQLVTLPNEEKALFVVLGDNYSMAISNKNFFYFWGNNSSGQFGNGTLNDSLTPIKVDLP